jgi:methionyl-tRNA formyltransferase
MVYELDAGDILYQEILPILETETTTELRTKLNNRALEIFPDFLEQFFHSRSEQAADADSYQPRTESLERSTLLLNIKQDKEKATFCKKIKKESLDVSLDLENKDLNLIYQKYKAYDKKIYFFYKTKRVKITEMKINTETRNVEILKVLPESKKEISLLDFQNSYGKIL